jgi:hypothetical protein
MTNPTTPERTPDCEVCRNSWPYCKAHNFFLLEPSEEMKAETAEIAKGVAEILEPTTDRPDELPQWPTNSADYPDWYKQSVEDGEDMKRD